MTSTYEKHPVNSAQEFAHLSNTFASAREEPIFWGAKRNATEDYKGIYNEKTETLAQVASDSYQIIQHRDIVSALADTLAKRGITVKGNVLECGHILQANLVFQNQGTPVKDSESGMQLGLRLSNSYNRAYAFRLEMFGFRLICTNGMVLGKALRNIREVVFHTGDEKTPAVLQKICSDFIDNVIASSDELQSLVSDAMKDKTEWQSIGKLLEKLLQHKKHREAICDKLGIDIIEVEDKKTKKVKFSYVAREKMPKLLTRWDLYNAITDYASHTEKMGLSVESKMQELAQKVLVTPYERLIEVETD